MAAPPARWLYHARYRAFRLRRRIVAVALLPLAGAAMSLWRHPETAPLADPRILAAVMLLWAAATLWHHLRFPGGWTEALPMALIFTALLATTGDLTAGASAPALADKGVQLALLGLLMSFVLGSMVLIWLLPMLMISLPRRTMRSRFSAHVPLPPEALERALLLRAGTQTASHRCGEADADGFFPVSFVSQMPDPESFEVTAQEFSYRVKLIEAAPGVYIQHCVVPETGASTMLRQSFQPEGAGTRYQTEEVHDNFNDPTRLLFWLDDGHADALTAAVDAAKGLPPRAIKLQPQDTMLTALAGWLHRSGLQEPTPRP